MPVISDENFKGVGELVRKMAKNSKLEKAHLMKQL